MRDLSEISGLLAGEESAVECFLEVLEELSRRIGRAQYRFSAGDVEEITLDVFEKLWRDDKQALRSWRGKGSIRAYLSVVINNACLMRLRKEKKLAREVGTDYLDSFESPPEPSPLELEEAAALYREAMGSLSARDRRLIEMRFLEERDYPAIVAEAGGSYGAVRKAVHTALGRLRSEMQELAPDLFSGNKGSDGASTTVEDA